MLSIAGLLAAGAAAMLFWPAREPPPTAAVPQGEAPKFAHFDVPNEKVKVRAVGEGFEVINTDPSLTGSQVEFAGVTTDGKRIPYSIKLPPPVPNAAQP